MLFPFFFPPTQPASTLSKTHQTRNDEVADDDSSHRPPALLLTCVKEDDAPEHVKQDDGHGHEGWKRKHAGFCKLQLSYSSSNSHHCCTHLTCLIYIS